MRRRELTERATTAPPTAIERELTRRGFVVGGALGLAALSQAVGWLRGAENAFAQAGLPGPGLSPDDPAVRATMTAYADTIVPGPAGGADGQPGAVEAGAVEEIYDPFYGTAGTYPFIHQDIHLATVQVLGRPAQFDLELPYADRERVVLDRIASSGSGGSNPSWLAYQGAAILVYLAYVGTARSELGPRYLRFPPRAGSYWPGHSYRVRFRGMTRGGNPR